MSFLTNGVLTLDMFYYVLKRFLILSFIGIVSIYSLVLISRSEYKQLVQSPNQYVRCGVYKGSKEVRKTRLHNPNFYKVFAFDNDNFDSDIYSGDFNLGPSEKRGAGKLYIGDRVCLTFSQGVVIKIVSAPQ